MIKIYPDYDSDDDDDNEEEKFNTPSLRSFELLVLVVNFLFECIQQTIKDAMLQEGSVNQTNIISFEDEHSKR